MSTRKGSEERADLRALSPIEEKDASFSCSTELLVVVSAQKGATREIEQNGCTPAMTTSTATSSQEFLEAWGTCQCTRWSEIKAL